MTNTAVVDTARDEGLAAWWFLDILAIEHVCAPGMRTVVMEATLPLGGSPPLHVHDELDDTWFMLEGEMLVRCGEDERVARAGDWVSLPRGVPHTFLVTGDRDARILMVHDDTSFRDFVRDVGVPARKHIVPPTPSFPPMEELARIAAQHGLTIVGPPMGAPTGR